MYKKVFFVTVILHEVKLPDIPLVPATHTKYCRKGRLKAAAGEDHRVNLPDHFGGKKTEGKAKKIYLVSLLQNEKIEQTENSTAVTAATDTLVCM